MRIVFGLNVNELKVTDLGLVTKLGRLAASKMQAL